MYGCFGKDNGDVMMMIERLIKAAKKGDWRFIDLKISQVSNDPEFVRWAKEKGLYEENENIRDLAVSLLEKTERLDEETKEKLYSLMSRDPSVYVRFRSAFALTNHDYDKHPQEIINVLKQATQDPEVKEIAENYLNRGE